MTEILFLPDGHTVTLLESSLPAPLLIEAVRSGRWLAPPPYGGMLFTALQQGELVVIAPAPSANLLRRPRPIHLPPRQREVLQLLAEGLTTREIAQQMGIRVRTVALHIRGIKEHLGTQSRSQAVARAVELGLIRRSTHKPEI